MMTKMMKQTPAPRPCRQCGVPFVPAHQNGWICSDECRRRRALASSRRWEVAHPERRRETGQAWRDANRDHYRAQKRAARAANPDHYRAKRREFYHAHKAQEAEAYRIWQAKNRAQRTAYMHEWERRRAAIADGKARFAGEEDGFLLIRARSGFWRAGVPDSRPIGRTEQIVARFVARPSEGQGLEWNVLAPALASQPQRQWAARLARSEQRRVRRFSTSGSAVCVGREAL